MYKLDSYEKQIIQELIRNPRISDNQIAIRTNVPLKTVNRKRKFLEQKGYLNYFCYFNNTLEGTGTFLARTFFVVLLKEGITRRMIVEKMHSTERSLKLFSKHILFTFMGEYEGNIALISLVESHKHDDLLEIFNAEMMPEIESYLGSGAVKRAISFPITNTLRVLRNYLPRKNMKNGLLKEDWPNEYIFVDD